MTSHKTILVSLDKQTQHYLGHRSYKYIQDEAIFNKAINKTRTVSAADETRSCTSSLGNNSGDELVDLCEQTIERIEQEELRWINNYLLKVHGVSLGNKRAEK